MMVIPTELTVGAQKPKKGRRRESKAEDAGGRRRDAGSMMRRTGLREAKRFAALQRELSALGDVALGSATEAGMPCRAAGGMAAAATPVIRGSRDARHSYDPSELEQVLNHFAPDLKRTRGAPSVLVVVAHQDDETIGAGTQLARLSDVTVVHVTDGAPRDPAYAHRFGYSTASEYGEARRREAAEALRLAGVPEERQLCLGIPDGEASYHLVDLSLRLAEIMDCQRPDVVLTHPYEGGHTDHDAIAFAVHLACGVLRRERTPTPTVLELTSYHYSGGRRVVHDFLPTTRSLPTRTVRLSRSAQQLKSRMYECFTTQQRCLKQFDVEVERFRPAPRYIFTRPPHEGPLDYERLTRRLSYSDWKTQAERALERLRSGRAAMVSTPQRVEPEPTPAHVPTITAANSAEQFEREPLEAEPCLTPA